MRNIGLILLGWSARFAWIRYGRRTRLCGMGGGLSVLILLAALIVGLAGEAGALGTKKSEKAERLLLQFQLGRPLQNKSH